MSHLNAEITERAKALVALYPEPRSALIPMCHLAQEQDGWLRPEAMEEIAELVGVTPAEVRGTATFYDMLHTEPVGTYVVSVCTNIACMLGGALELLEHAESTLGIACRRHHDRRCLHPRGGRVPGRLRPHARACRSTTATWAAQTAESFDQLVATSAPARLSDTVPPHGTLVRVRRSVGLQADGGRHCRRAGPHGRGPGGPGCRGSGGDKA